MSRNRGRRNRRIKRKRRKGWIWIVFILVAMLLAAGFWMLGQNYEGTGAERACRGANPPETEHPGILSFSGISGESYEPIASISGKTLEFIEKRNKEVCAKGAASLFLFTYSNFYGVTVPTNLHLSMRNRRACALQYRTSC